MREASAGSSPARPMSATMTPATTSSQTTEMLLSWKRRITRVVPATASQAEKTPTTESTAIAAPGSGSPSSRGPITAAAARAPPINAA